MDAAAGEWLAVLLVDGQFMGSDLQPSITAILERHPDASVCAVDIPIGLPRGGFRPADVAARHFVGGKRASSVFSTPPAAVLSAPTYPLAVTLARSLLGAGIPAQSFALRERVFEVAVAAEADARVVEVHPEVSFRAMKGAGLIYSKHSWSGIAERRALLAAVGIVLPDGLPGGGRAAPDDVVDAAVAAWSAMRVATRVSLTLPSAPSGNPAEGGVIHY